ncbi:MAG: LLM class flavin-dependent oxidoreductase [Acidimicrobiia bacterium]|nr:LLM class flavin-dependent oxidoreductase [Acidimicrobiia bacterium]
MRLGASLPIAALGGGPLTAASLADGARLIERLGYRSIWVFDAVGRGFMLPDPLLALAVAATVTNQVELGTGVLQLPIRATPDLAHRILTLHLVAGDRLLLGVGPGSTRVDFEVFGGDYEQRFSRFEEQLGELREWLATGSSGDHSLTPWPAVSGGPALYLAGWRGRWVERAATESAGWIASAAYADDDALADGIARFRHAGGRRAIVTNVQIADDLDPGLDRLHRLADLGFDDAIVVDRTPSEDRLAELITRWLR